MNKYNTKLGQMLSLIDRSQFGKLVKLTESDKHCKGFSTWQQLVVMFYAQIACPNVLRKLVNALNENSTCLYHLGITKGKSAVPRFHMRTTHVLQKFLSSCFS